MDTLRTIGRRLRVLVQRARVEHEIDEEMRLHLALRAEKLRASGLSSSDARLAARHRFGNPATLRERSLDVWGWRWLEALAQDASFALRMLRRSPAFAATAILTLALATGATTSIFSIVDSVLLRPLPFDEPDRLVQVYGRMWREDRGGQADPVNGPVASPELQAYRNESTTFEDFAGYFTSTRHLLGPSGPERLTAVEGQATLFTTLRAEPLLGRTFAPGDPPDVAVISAGLWRRRFNGDPSIPGTSVTLDGRPYTVVGVMPDAFEFPYGGSSLMQGVLSESRTDLWLSLPPRPRGRVSVVGRMKPGVDSEAAQSELRVIAARLTEQQFQGTRIRVDARVEPLADVVLGPVRSALWVLFAAVALVLVAACANVANLLLARMTARARELVTRAALGAGRLRLVRQLLAESLVLSLAGGLLGLAIAQWGTRLLVVIGAAKMPRAHEIALDWRTFVFLLSACMVTAVLFGLAPALAAARVDVVSVTKESGSGTATAGRRYRRIRDGLVIVEVALAFVLALGAALVVREVARLKSTPAGMVTDNVVTFHMTPRAMAAEYYAIEERVGHLSGVASAGFVQLVPLQNWGWEADFAVRGRTLAGRPVAGLRYVTPGYFRTLGIPVMRGRSFTGQDSAGAPPVVMINQALARRYFGDEDPVGIALDRGTIVGVVGDVRQAGLDKPAEPEIYYPAAQNVTMASDLGMTLFVRTTGRPEPHIEPIRSVIREVSPNLAVFNVKTMEQVIGDSLWELNLYRWLIGLFAALALVLAAIGLYGVISYGVTSRMREFAIRLALGSDPLDLLWLVLRRAVRLAALGLLAGAAAALAIVPFVRDSRVPLTGDPVVYGLIAAVLVTIALAASFVPALTAARVNAAAALRHD